MLVQAIEQAGKDITSDYNDWYRIGIAIAYEYGEQGRYYFHRISKLYNNYNYIEADKKYNQCMHNPSPMIRINTIYYYAKQASVQLPHSSHYASFPQTAETAETAETAGSPQADTQLPTPLQVKRVMELLCIDEEE